MSAGRGAPARAARPGVLTSARRTVPRRSARNRGGKAGKPQPNGVSISRRGRVPELRAGYWRGALCCVKPRIAARVAMRSRSSSGRSTANGRSSEREQRGQPVEPFGVQLDAGPASLSGSAPPAGGISYVATLAGSGRGSARSCPGCSGSLRAGTGFGEPGQDVLRRSNPAGGSTSRAGSWRLRCGRAGASGPRRCRDQRRSRTSGRSGRRARRGGGCVRCAGRRRRCTGSRWACDGARRRRPRAGPGVRGGCLAGRGGEGEGAEHGVEPAGEPLRQYPADLGRRRLACRAGGRHQPRPAARDQAEQHGQRLVVAEHQRRHAVTGIQPAPAVVAVSTRRAHQGRAGGPRTAAPSAHPPRACLQARPPSGRRPTVAAPAKTERVQSAGAWAQVSH